LPTTSEFDDYFNDDQIENVVKWYIILRLLMANQTKIWSSPLSWPLKPRLEYPALKDFTRFCNEGGTISFGENAFHENIALPTPLFQAVHADIGEGVI